MPTNKDTILLVARAIKRAGSYYNGYRQTDTMGEGAFRGVCRAMHSIADEFSATIPRFDRTKFIKDCGNWDY